MATSDYSFHTYTVTHTYTVAITGFLITYLFDIMHKHQRLFKDSPYTHSVQSNTQFPECLTRLVISVRVFLVLIFAMFIVFEFTLLFCIVIFALLLHCFTFVVCRSHDLWPVLDSEYWSLFWTCLPDYLKSWVYVCICVCIITVPNCTADNIMPPLLSLIWKC